MTASRPTLRQRFEHFMGRLPQVELIDDLLKGRDPHGMRRADYLLGQRRIIIEQKSLEVDPSDKLDDFIGSLLDEREIVIFGTISTDQAFAGQTDLEAIRRKMHDIVTKSVRSAVEEASRQARDTRLIFSIPRAAGVVILLNDRVNALDPEIIAHAAAKVLRTKKQDGTLRYSGNSAIMIFSETHVIDPSAQTKTFLIPIIMAPEAQKLKGLDVTLNQLAAAWARYNGSQFNMTEDTSLISDLKPV